MEREELLKTVLKTVSEVAITSNRKLDVDTFFSIAFMTNENLKKLYRDITGKCIT